MAFLNSIKSLLSPRASCPKITFQVLSDLHLEVGNQYTSFSFPVTAPILILAGDIGRLVDEDAMRAFFTVQIVRYEKVLWVLGNHEFYGLSHSKSLEIAMRLESEFDGKLIVLYRRRFDLPEPNITVLGCTLWSQIPDEAKNVVRSKVNDFRRINDWTVGSHNAEHQKDLSWLKEQVSKLQEESPQRRILIVTHHAACTSGTSEPRFEGSPWHSAFATDLLERKGDWPGVQAWVYGHTHYSTGFVKAGVRVVSNQRGYVLPAVESRPSEAESKKNGKNFDPKFVLRL
ncbi:putative calcineurin-like phosphoesterase [Microthyrium microscopicum]|uniref:Putative calcineurin-like phosphoesterase n=1 Tax=Microthyrium microscopicum TaxID=703497 RepID=A0A6A6UI32_9PEZI|nr:putative calcineurin-like phosphoesterase [Microthyrium microscopicum]